MRVFGSQNIKNMMGRFGIPEDEPISSKLVSRALEGAQEKIEGFHFDSRKHTLEFDDVMNHQRNIIYERRQKMLLADKDGIEELLQRVAEGRQGAGEILAEKRKKLTKVIGKLFLRLRILLNLKLEDMPQHAFQR